MINAIVRTPHYDDIIGLISLQEQIHQRLITADDDDGDDDDDIDNDDDDDDDDNDDDDDDDASREEGPHSVVVRGPPAVAQDRV